MTIDEAIHFFKELENKKNCDPDGEKRTIFKQKM